MSTQIYHGRIKRNATLDQVHADLVGIRPEYVRTAREAIATVMARKLAFGRDLAENLCLIDPECNHWSRKRVVAKFEDAYRHQDDTLKALNWDFTCSVSVIPYRGDVLMLTHWRNYSQFAELIERAGFMDFHYQNSTDKPDSISEAEWDARRDAWDEAMPSGRAAEVAFQFQLVSWIDVLSARYDSDLIRACAPTEQTRRERVAYHLTEAEQIAHCTTPSEAMRIHRKVRELYPNRVPTVHLSSTPLQEA